MSKDQLAELTKDIEVRGLDEPIQLDADGLILDGRNRYLACEDALRPSAHRYRKWPGKGSPEKYLAFVIAHNLHRRHQTMTGAQRAQLVVSLNAKFLAKEGSQLGNVAELKTLKTSKTLANEANVSPRTITTARAVHDNATPQEEREVIDGTKTPAAVLDAAAGRAIRPRSPTTYQDTGREPPPEEPLKDPFGNIMPKHVEAAFEEMETLTKIKNAMDEMRRDIEQLCKDGDKIATFIQFQSVESGLKTAAAAIRFAYPYCVCPMCGGDAKRCKACRESGWLPKELYGQIIPREMQWKKKA